MNSRQNPRQGAKISGCRARWFATPMWSGIILQWVLNQQQRILITDCRKFTLVAGFSCETPGDLWNLIVIHWIWTQFEPLLAHTHRNTSRKKILHSALIFCQDGPCIRSNHLRMAGFCCQNLTGHNPTSCLPPWVTHSVVSPSPSFSFTFSYKNCWKGLHLLWCQGYI